MSRLKINNKEFEQIAILIEEARTRAFRKVNEELVALYFKVGGIVSEKVAAGSWGDATVDDLAKYISEKLPGLNGFNRRGLYRMKQFFEVYSIEQFISPLAPVLRAYLNYTSGVVSQAVSAKSRTKASKKLSAAQTQTRDLDLLYQQFVTTVLTQLQWSAHLHLLNKTKTPEEKLYYLLLSIKEKLSVRELERQLNTGVYERSIKESQIVSPPLTQFAKDIFKDPYIFEFLDLPDVHSEKDLEQALTKNLQKFILEIGKGFTYMGNQFRLQVGNKDYYTDLLFYHRDLQCLVLFELKIQEFEPEFLGKLNFYLEALDRAIKRRHEKSSVGILLCKGKDVEVVEYAMARNSSPAMIADYETKLIPKKILLKKLHQLAEQLSNKGLSKQ